MPPTQTKKVADKKAAQASLTSESNSLELLLGLENAPEVQLDNPVIQDGDDNTPPMVMAQGSSAGYIELRRNSDGALRQVNKNQLKAYAKMRLPDGRLSWISPNVEWKGTVRVPDQPCLLSSEHPNRPRMDELNMPVCSRRGKLMGHDGLRRHMIKKHKDAWEALQLTDVRDREDARDQRDNLNSQALIQALGKAGSVAEVVDRGEDPATRQTV